MGMALGQTYLSELSHSVADVAFSLGFSEASAFQRWFGMAPAAYRRPANWPLECTN